MAFTEKIYDNAASCPEGGTERPLKDYERLAKIVTEVSRAVNREVEESFGVSNVIETDGTVRMESFGQSEGGIYDDETVKRDLKATEDMELGFTGATDPKVASFYAKVRNCTTPAEIIGNWKKEKKKGKSGMFEDAVQVLLYKFFNRKFLVVRSAPYDDYKAGVDNLIINKETGDVICAFDEVHDSNDGGYTAKKLEKVKKIANKGGATIRYGLSVADGKLKQLRIERVPVLAISIAAEKFKELLPAILEGELGTTSEKEIAFMNDIIGSLQDQVKIIEPLARDERMKNNLERFKSHLEKMKGDLG